MEDHTNTPIYLALMKAAAANVDVEYYIDNLFLFQAGTWFMPTNNNSNDYSICQHMAELNLIEIKRVPNWRNGQFRGIAVYFRYNKDLQY